MQCQQLLFKPMEEVLPISLAEQQCSQECAQIVAAIENNPGLAPLLHLAVGQ